MDWDELIIQQVTAASGPGIEDLLRAGDALFAQGEWKRALFHYLVVVRQRPEVAKHHYRMGAACWRLGQAEAAQFSFEEALRLDPDDAQAHGELSRVLLHAGEADRALEHAQRAVQLVPDDPNLGLWLATWLEENDQSDEAWDIVDRLIRAGHESTVAILCARMAPHRKREADALDLIQRVLQRGQFQRAREPSSLHFAAANLLDHIGRYDEAFDHASQANVLRNAKYDPGAIERQVRNWIHYFTPAKFRQLPRATHGIDAPVFIVGVPRSGSTLLEQILASHPSVHAAGELDWMTGVWESALQRCNGAAVTLMQCLDQLSLQDVNDLAAEFLKPLLTRGDGAIRITDKTLYNGMNLGLIALLFPKAKIIHCRRSPLDVCVSCYMTDFAVANEFSFNLESCGQFYRLYEQMMAHWKTVLDLEILEVEYEQVVHDLEGQTRSVLQFLGLPWDERCLRFYENRRFISTASRAQVRLSIYQHAIGRWRHYDKHLGPLRAALAGM